MKPGPGSYKVPDNKNGNKAFSMGLKFKINNNEILNKPGPATYDIEKSD